MTISFKIQNLCKADMGDLYQSHQNAIFKIVYKSTMAGYKHKFNYKAFSAIAFKNWIKRNYVKLIFLKHYM